MADKLPIRRYDSAGGIVVDAAGDHVLVLIRPGRLGPDERPEIRLPKGHVEPGESPHQTAVREVCEETGLLCPRILADLGHQVVEFDWRGSHYVRSERYYLMTIAHDMETSFPEKQFKPLWLSWEKALSRLTFEAERQWVRRARAAWTDRLGV